MHGQEFARLEAESLGAGGELDQVDDAAWLAAYLDYVAALDGGGGDLDVRGEGAAWGPSGHWVTRRGSDRSSGVWQGQSQAS